MDAEIGDGDRSLVVLLANAEGARLQRRLDLDAELGGGFDDVDGGFELSVVLGGLGGEGKGGAAFEMIEAAGERDSNRERRSGR